MHEIEELKELVREEEERVGVQNINVIKFEEPMRQNHVVRLMKRLNGTKYGLEESMSFEAKDAGMLKRIVVQGVRKMRDFEYTEFGKTVTIDGRDITVVLESEMFKARCDRCAYGKTYDRPNYAPVAITEDGNILTRIEEERKPVLFMGLVAEISQKCICARKSKDLYSNSAIIQ